MVTFPQRVLARYGADGEAWVRNLPDTLGGLRTQWRLELDAPFPCLTFTYAAPARRRDGSDAVLKLAFSGDKEFLSEVEALRLFDGRGAARLLEVDRDRHAMLLERLHPGTPLAAESDDVTATGTIADLLPQLRRPVPEQHSFPTVAGWSAGIARLRRRFGGTTGPLPAQLVGRAEALVRDLLATAADAVVLHGDLHHGNVLRAQRQPWLAIDPKGVVGEPVYETAAMLRNPLPDLLTWPYPKRVLARRIDQLSDRLGFPRQRIHAWGVAQTVLSAVWTLEDEGAGWEPAIACAELLSELRYA